MYSRVGNKEKTYEEIGEQSYIRATSEIVTDFSQGTLEPTDIPLDFAIEGDGFFAMRNTEGDLLYTAPQMQHGGLPARDSRRAICHQGFYSPGHLPHRRRKRLR